MNRLALYAHFSPANDVAAHVLFCVRELARLGFQICFVSNSPISATSAAHLNAVCQKVLLRENSGLDFSMWQRGLAEYDPASLDELLLTNSSVIGPLHPLESLWQNPAAADCDFWGLTDSEEFAPHVQSYFLVFKKAVLKAPQFTQFWKSVLPYRDKYQIIFSYELGLTKWLEEAGYRWRVVFPLKDIFRAHRDGSGAWTQYQEKLLVVRQAWRDRRFPARNSTLLYPDLLLQRGMPFLKASLLRQASGRVSPQRAFALLEKSRLPDEVLAELRRNHQNA